MLCIAGLFILQQAVTYTRHSPCAKLDDDSCLRGLYFVFTRFTIHVKKLIVKLSV